MIRSSSMHNSQQSSGSAAPWTLPAGQALRLPVGPGGRWLQARSGALWLTRSLPAGGAAVSEDVVLQAGQGLALPGGSEWVLEGWGAEAAAFELLVPPSACARRPGGAAEPEGRRARSVRPACAPVARACVARARPARVEGARHRAPQPGALRPRRPPAASLRR